MFLYRPSNNDERCAFFLLPDPSYNNKEKGSELIKKYPLEN